MYTYPVHLKDGSIAEIEAPNYFTAITKAIKAFGDMYLRIFA